MAKHVSNDIAGNKPSGRGDMDTYCDFSGGLHDEENDPLSYYLKQINKIPLLTPELEKLYYIEMDCFKDRLSRLRSLRINGEIDGTVYEREKKVYEKRLLDVKNRLITSNLRLVVSIAFH